jgi:hypothetical protein
MEKLGDYVEKSCVCELHFVVLLTLKYTVDMFWNALICSMIRCLENWMKRDYRHQKYNL